MITVTSRSDDLPTWRLRADQRFVEQYNDARDNAGNDFESNVESKIDRICQNPLHGSRKNGRLNGLRSLHIEHLVALWEVSPEITSREYTDRVEEIYFVGLVHHDDYHRCVVNRQPVEPYRDFTVVMRGDNTSQRHLVYELDGVTVNKEQWFTKNQKNGVILNGVYDKDSECVFDSELPVGTGVSTSVRVSEGLNIGITNRRILSETKSDIETPVV